MVVVHFIVAALVGAAAALALFATIARDIVSVNLIAATWFAFLATFLVASLVWGRRE